MATEANILESVCLKGEREGDALISEGFEEKVTELPGNQVKQLETSSLVAAETVNTPLETGKPTAESGIFFQALSVTMVIADEHSNTPESCKAAKQTEPEEQTIQVEEKAVESEVCAEDVPEKAEHEVESKVLDSVEPSKKEAFSVLEKNQGDSDGVTSSLHAACEDRIETTKEHAAVVADFKQDVNETPKDFVEKVTDDKAVDPQEASEQHEIGLKDTEEQKYEESVKKDEETEEIKPDVETEKREQNGSLQAVTSDVFISTETSQVETTKHEEIEQDVNVLEKDQDEDDVTITQEKNHQNEDNEHDVVKAKGSVDEDADVSFPTQTMLVEESIKQEPEDEKAEKEVSEENGPEKAELEGGLAISDSVASSLKETLSTTEKDQGDSDGVTTLQESPCVDVEETTTVQHVTTAVDLKEQDFDVNSREFIKEESEDKPVDAPEAIEECEKEAKEETGQKLEESGKKIEKDDETEEIKPSVEIEEKKEQNESLPTITNDVCTTTQTESQVEKTEHEDEDTPNDDGLKEKPDNNSNKEVCEETGSEKDEHEKEVKHSAIATVTNIENEDVTLEKELQVKNHHNEDDERKVVAAEESIEKDTDSSSVALNESETVGKDEDQEKEQEIYVSEKVQSSGDDVTSSENASNEQEQHTEDNKPGVETTEEKDVCTSTQVESQENDSKNEEDAVEKDGDQVYEESDLKKTEPKEEIKLSDSSNVITRESVDEATEEAKSSDETKENTEQQGVLNDITTDICSPTQTENIEKTTASEENNDVKTIENNDGQTDKPKSPLVEVACEATRSEVAELEEVTHSDTSSTTLTENQALSKEENLEKEDDIKTSEVQGGGDDVTTSQNASNEDIKETTVDQRDTAEAYIEEGQGVTAIPKETLIEETEEKLFDAEEFGPNEQNVEEAHPDENTQDEIKKENKDLSYESVEDTNDDGSKEENSTLEQEPVEEHSDHNEVSKEKVTDSNISKEVEPTEQIIPSTEDTSSSEKEKAETENLPAEKVETVSKEQITELLPKSEEPMLKDGCLVSETETVTTEISSAEKTEVQGGRDDVTSPQNASSEDIQETMIGQKDTTETFVEEGQSVSSAPKEILIEEVEDKSIVAEEMTLELGQPNEQHVEEADSCLSKSLTEDPKDEIKKEDKDLSHENVVDTNDEATKEEKCTLEQELVEENSGRDEVSKEKVTDLNQTSTEVNPKEEIIPSTSLETSTEDASNSEKEKAESENLSIEDLETVSEVQIPEVVPDAEEPILKETCVVSETGTHLDEEKITVTEKDEKVNVSTESQGEDNLSSSQIEVSEEKEDLKEHNEVNEGDFIKSGEDVDENAEEIKSSVDTKENTEHVTATKVCSSTKLETHEDKTENEEKSGEKDTDYDEHITVSREENPEREQEDHVEVTKIGEHATANEEKDVCITTQDESQEEPAKNEENVTEHDDDLKEKLDNPVVKEVCEEDNLKTIESEETKLSDSSDVKTTEGVDEATEETKPSDVTSENREQQGLLDVSISDVCSSTETEIIEKTTASEENTDVEIIKNDDGQTEKPESPLDEVVCETTKSEIVECEEAVKQSDSFSTILNENEPLSKEEKLEKEDEIKTSQVEDDGVEITSSQNASNEDIKETTVDQHNSTAADVEEGQDVSALPKEILIEEAEDKSIDTKEMLVELGQPKENQEDEIKKEDRDLSHESVQDTNDNTSKEEKCTLEHEPIEEHSSRDFNETTEAEPQEDITPSISIKSSAEDTSNSEKENAESENLSIKDLETVSEVQMTESVPKAEKDTQFDEEKGTVTENISRDETTEIKQVTVKEVCEETSSDKVESEEKQLSDSLDVKTSEIVKEDAKETKSSNETKENIEQQGVLNVITADVSSSTQTHNVEKSTATEENNDEETTELNEKPESPLVDVVCEETRSEVVESEEEVKHSDSFSTTLNENAALSKEQLENEDDINTSEVQGGVDEVTSLQTTSNDDVRETKIGQDNTIVAHVEEGQDVSVVPKEILTEKAKDKSIDAEEISLELGQPNEQNVEKTHPCASKTIGEVSEDEITKEDRDLFHESVEDTNTVEEHRGQDEESKEKVTDINETTVVEPQEDIIPSLSLETSTEVTSNSVKEKAESENLPIEDLETVSEVQVPEAVLRSEESVLKEECFPSKIETHLDEEKGTITEKISSDEKTEETTEIKQETIKEVFEETSSEKTDVEEGSKLSDPSDMTINEKEITAFKDEDQEKVQEVSVSAERQGEDDIKSSQNEVSEEKEYLQEKNNHNEGDLIKSGEGVDEHTKDIKSSVETEETTEHVITTNVSSSTQIEHNEETTESNGNKVIENDEKDIVSREFNLERKLEDVCSSAQTEPKEETVESKEANEEAIENDDGQMNPETHEKEQKPEVSELQGGGDDGVSSQNTSTEDAKETAIGQHDSTTVHFEEALGETATTKEIIGDEVENKFIHVLEASEQCENEATDNIEQQQEESVDKPVTPCSETIEGGIKEQAHAENKKTEPEEEAENQADRTEDGTEMKDEAVLTEKVSKDLEQTKEQNLEETEPCLSETTTEKTEDKITKDEDLSRESIEHINEDITTEEKWLPDVITKEIEISTLEHKPVEKQNDSQDEVPKEKLTDLKEPAAVEPQEDITPSSSLETSAEDTSNSNKSVTEKLPLEDLESVSEVHIPEIIPISEDSKVKEECLVSEIETYADEQNRIVTKDVSSNENLETHGSTQQPENSYSTTEDNTTELVHEKQISNSDSIPAENPETEVTADSHIRHEDLQVKKDAAVEFVDLSNIESTAYPSESEKLATQALESDRDVTITEVAAGSEESQVKEEFIVSATAAENSLEEHDTKIDEISSAPDTEQENVANAPNESDEAKSSDLFIEEKALPKENLEIHGDIEPTSKPVTEEEQVTIETKHQPEQSDIKSESIINDQTSESKLEHTSVEDLEDGIKGNTKEDVTLAPEIETKNIEYLNETTKNIILTDEVALQTEKDRYGNEIEGQVSEEDKCPTELDSTSTAAQKELADEIEYSKPIPVANTEVKEEKAESQIEVENIQAAEDDSCLSKASSSIETSKVEMREDTEQNITSIEEVKDDSVDEASKDQTVSVLEDSKTSELQVNLLDEEAKQPQHNQLTSETDVCQIERSTSRPGELLETKDSVEDTEDAKFTADKLSVKDETSTVIQESYEDSETVASEQKRFEDTVTDKEKDTLNVESQADDSAKTTEVAELVPEVREASANLTDKLPEPSPEVLLTKPEDTEVQSSVEKDVIDVQKHDKDLDHETKDRTADLVSSVEFSEIQPRNLDEKEAISELINQENQREQTEHVIPVEDVKTSTKEPEVGNVDRELPSIIDATTDKANDKTLEVHEAGGLLKDDKHLEPTCDQSKPTEENSGIKQEPLELDAPETPGTAAAKDIKISPTYVADDLIKASQTPAEIPKYEAPSDKQSPNEPHPKERTEKTDSSHEQEKYESTEPAKTVLHEPAKGDSEVAENIITDKDLVLTKDQQVEKEETGVKTDEEVEEEEDNEDDEKIGSGSDAPVMVEASKDMEVKAHKKSHNILSGVGSKVKHSIAKVKKAITGKSSPSKSTSPKAKNQVSEKLE